MELNGAHGIHNFQLDGSRRYQLPEIVALDVPSMAGIVRCFRHALLDCALPLLTLPARLVCCNHQASSKMTLPIASNVKAAGAGIGPTPGSGSEGEGVPESRDEPCEGKWLPVLSPPFDPPPPPPPPP